MRLSRKWHNHTLQTNPRRRGEEALNTNNYMKLKDDYSKASSYCLILSEMIAK